MFEHGAITILHGLHGNILSVFPAIFTNTISLPDLRKWNLSLRMD